ncbi:MAG: carbon-nitrogen hydrolase family protein [Pseudomonadota bacterium]
MTILHLACVQLCGSNQLQANVTMIREAVAMAASQGAQLISLPEVCNLVERNPAKAAAILCDEQTDPVLQCLKTLARQHRCWIHAGSLALRHGILDKAVNRAFIINAEGAIIARYDKIHLFDATLPGGTVIRESDGFHPGENPVLATSEWGSIGLSICYDLRFAGLYRWLARAGAVMLAVPAAFTRPTGQAHWHVLLRARAIETGCFVFASAQCGDHRDGRQTYGHSMIIDPWGSVLAEANTCPEIIYADLDLDAVTRTRALLGYHELDQTDRFEPPR